MTSPNTTTPPTTPPASKPRRKHRVRIAALIASLATVLSGGLAATVASASAASASTNVHVINLHDAYRAALARAATSHKKVIFLPRGAHMPPRTGAAGCTEPDHCNMTYGGGPVQHSPKVYLLLWGPNWSSDSSQAATASFLQSFYGGLGVQPQDSWSTITSQYSDTTGHPSFSGSVFAGTWQDTSTPPTGATQSDLTAESDAFDATAGIPSGMTDAQVVVATQSGTSPSGFGSQYCGWHSTDDNSVPFTNLPYMLDAGANCGTNFISSQYDGFSIVGGHEYAETITDPYPNSGWWDAADSYGGEIGDKCAWGGSNWGGNDPSGDVSLSTGTFGMQSLYSNAAGQCVMSSTATQYATNPVSGLKASPRYTQITATWNASKNATSYRYRLRTTSGTLVTQGTVTGTSYIFHNLQALHTYVVYVLANPAAPGAGIAGVTTKTK
jgi:serine protease